MGKQGRQVGTRVLERTWELFETSPGFCRILEPQYGMTFSGVGNDSRHSPEGNHTELFKNMALQLAF